MYVNYGLSSSQVYAVIASYTTVQHRWSVFQINSIFAHFWTLYYRIMALCLISNCHLLCISLPHCSLLYGVLCTHTYVCMHLLSVACQVYGISGECMHAWEKTERRFHVSTLFHMVGLAVQVAV